jgi:predicted pyridoxine 5'-phosphate oxidase superfamily flavin-nucleotide-binding protein
VGFVQVLDEKHLAIPDRPGNRLAATFTNLIENPHVALIFLIPGKLETLRISGEARIVRDEVVRKNMAVDGKVPELAIIVYVEQAQIHCPKCMIRSKLWQPDAWPDSSGIATISEATFKHAKPPNMTIKELDDYAERDGWTKLY